jgi:hypothetical protein
MTRPIAPGELVETPEGWRVCVSIPDPIVPSLYRWRDGCRYTIPELVDTEAERRLVHAPRPPEPEDALACYIVVRATS